jgi:peptidoglycan/LPS O-acetylase OafA/YrhL
VFKLRALFPPLRPESESMLHLDTLRLLASCGIVVYAAGRTLDEFGARGPVTGLLGLFQGFTLWVDLFFAVSGFVIAWVYAERMCGSGDYGDFLRKRLARVGPLNWATFLFFLALGLVSAKTGGDGQVSDCALQNVLLLQSANLCGTPGFNHPSWSISAEMVMYAAFPAFLALGRHGAGALFAAAAAAFVGLSLIGGPYTERGWFDWTHDYGFLRAVPAFLFGMGLYKARDALARIRFAKPAMGLTLALFVLGAFAGLHKLMLLPVVYAVVLFAVAADGRGAGPLVRLLAPGGRLTYSLYMLHVPVFTVAVIAARRFPVLAGPVFAWWLLACAVVLFPLAYLSWVWFETPARRWIGRRRGRRVAPGLGQVAS